MPDVKGRGAATAKKAAAATKAPPAAEVKPAAGGPGPAAGEGPLGSVLVLGGGIGGMQAALDLAGAGFFVHLVTDEASIGGKMARLDKTFPTNDCAMCMLGPRMTDCQNHPNIDISTLATVEGLEGRPGRFKARIRRRPRYVDVKECTACGECEGVCPVEVPNGFNLGHGTQKAIHKLFPQAVPNAYLVEKRGRPPCRSACPAGCNVQGFVAMVGQGKFAEAVDVIRRTVPFPGICGRVCHHPCENECNRQQFDEPVAVSALKRAAADHGWEEYLARGAEARGTPRPWPSLLPLPERNGRKVAVVGGGPAGLTAALDLVRRGYAVTVFEALPRAGGMLLAGIPRYRLPEAIVEREVEAIRAEGVDIRTGVRVGQDIPWEELNSQFDAVLVAVGLQRSRSLAVEGIDAKGVLEGLSFLREAALGGRPAVGGRVLVMGAGSVAIDAAGTARRLGAGEVHLVWRRHTPPAHPWEVEEALEEGVQLHPGRGLKRVLTRGGRVVGVELWRTILAYDEQGRFTPRFQEGSEERFRVDTVILCVGQAPDLEFLPADGSVQTRPDRLVADGLTGETSLPGVFACGDITGGGATVVEAIASGHEAAESIDRHLSGRDLREGRGAPALEKLGPPEWARPAPERRAQPPRLEVERALAGFDEVGRGLAREAAVAEAGRCLDCGACSECLQCEQACQKNAMRHLDAGEAREVEVGAVILAPGFDLHPALSEGEYGYGVYPNVLTGYEFERLLSATGPTQGHLQRPSDGALPRRIAFLQCVGSRDAACGAEYCSSVCCLYTTKEAVVAREHERGVEPTVFYLDVRAFGKGFDRYVETAKKSYGVRYVRGMISALKEDPVTKNLALRYLDDGHQLQEEEFDLVVLATGVRPPRAAPELSRALGFELNPYGFAQVDGFNPVSTTRPGVFVAGAFRGPQDIPETIMTACAAASEAAELLAPGRGQLVRVKEYPPERDASGQEPRVGVFICRCGINIASVVDVAGVVEFAASLPGVAHAQETLYTCSQDSLKNIREVIAEKGLNRVVVASCTIRTHQTLFRETLRESGLNQFLFEMANIRDQCSWVHKTDPAGATEKACDLVRMAVAKVKQHRALTLHPVPVVQKALVVGGGIAGMTAALSFAVQGVPVHLLEREAELGGNLRRIHRTLEGADVQAFLHHTVERVESHPLITCLLEARLEALTGHAGHFTSQVSLRVGPDPGPRRLETLEHGAVVVATGAVEMAPDQYLYGVSPRVLTGLEFEALAAGGSPRLEGLREVAFVQCVGSREEGRMYCSRTCCAETVKNALLLKGRDPNLRVYVLYRDMRTYGFMEAYYRRAREAGVVFIPFPEDRRPEITERPGWLEVEVRDRAGGLDLVLKPDLLVLAAATVSPAETQALGSLLKVPVNEDGFFLETHIKLGPMDFASQGIYLCGSAHGPKFIEEAVYQAKGAAARAMLILSKPELMVGGVVATVDDKKCAACLTCVRVCPYNVPRISREGVAVIEAVQCQGCGTCAGECPGRAIQVGFYEDGQILAKLSGLYGLGGRR